MYLSPSDTDYRICITVSITPPRISPLKNRLQDLYHCIHYSPTYLKDLYYCIHISPL